MLLAEFFSSPRVVPGSIANSRLLAPRPPSTALRAKSSLIIRGLSCKSLVLFVSFSLQHSRRDRTGHHSSRSDLTLMSVTPAAPVRCNSNSHMTRFCYKCVFPKKTHVWTRFKVFEKHELKRIHLLNESNQKNKKILLRTVNGLFLQRRHRIYKFVLFYFSRIKDQGVLYHPIYSNSTKPCG